MRIKFLDHDPRAGEIAEMDSSRGQQLIDQGAAVQVPDSDVAEPKSPTPKLAKAAKKKAK